MEPSQTVNAINPGDVADRIRRHVTSAISDYELIRSGDRVMVAVSGGKDSTIMALTLVDIQKRTPYKFDLGFVMLDQKQPGFDANRYKAWLDSKGVRLTIIEEDTYSIVKDKTAAGKSYCGLCSRLRRGILYNYATQEGYSRIALGHHRDDINTTLLMNLFYGGQLATMPPKLKSDDGRNVVIRPLCYVKEEWLSSLAKAYQIPLIPCNLCGSQDNLRRAKVKKLIAGLARDEVALEEKIFASQANLKLSHLLDRQNFQFSGW
jgi:tRNA 2-thiocytidine biosynthesis protein TtcA